MWIVGACGSKRNKDILVLSLIVSVLTRLAVGLGAHRPDRRLRLALQRRATYTVRPLNLYRTKIRA